MASIPPPPPPERPTEQIYVPPAEPLVRERVLAAPPLEAGLLAARLSSLQTWLAIVALIAVAAIAVAIYALTRDNKATTSAGASDARVTQLDARVNSLSSQVKSLRPGAGAGAASSSTTAALGTRVGALEHSVSTLTSRPAAADPTQAISQLSTRVDTLASQVAALKQAPPQTPPTTP